MSGLSLLCKFTDKIGDLWIKSHIKRKIDFETVISEISLFRHFIIKSNSSSKNDFAGETDQAAELRIDRAYFRNAKFVPTSPRIPAICFPLIFNIPPHVLPDDVQNSNVERGFTLAQWTTQDVHVGQGTCDIKEGVKDLFPKFPSRREDRPRLLETTEETLDQHRLVRSCSSESSHKTTVGTS